MARCVKVQEWEALQKKKEEEDTKAEGRKVIKDRVILVLTAVFWHLQTIAIAYRHVHEFSIISFLLVFTRSTVLPPTRPNPWLNVYASSSLLVTIILVLFKLWAKYSNLNTLDKCDVLVLWLDYFGLDDWDDATEELLDLVHVAPLAFLLFHLPEESACCWKLPSWLTLNDDWRIWLQRCNCILWLFFAGTLWPSVLGSMYFTMAMSSAFIWAWNYNLVTERAYDVLLRALQWLALSHHAALVLYQHAWAQYWVPPENPLLRILGMNQISAIYCQNPYRDPSRTPLEVTDPDQTSPKHHEGEEDFLVALPGRLAVASLAAVFYAVRWLIRSRKAIAAKKRDEDVDRNLRTVAENSSGINIQEKSTQDLPDTCGDEEEKGEEEIPAEEAETHLEDLLMGTINNITLMVWSAWFHSWQGLLLLVCSSVLWVLPRRRDILSLSSRVLSGCAGLFLVLAYIFSLDYEWPSHLAGIPLVLSGLRHHDPTPAYPLLVKSGMTIVFLTVLRQYTKPFFHTLRIPLSGFAKWLQVVRVLWTRICVLILMAMICYDVRTYRLIGFGLSFGLTLGLAFPSLTNPPIYIFFVVTLLFSVFKLFLTYLFQFEGFPEFIANIFGWSLINMYNAIGIMGPVDRMSLLVHLWLPTIAAVVSAIFLTFVRQEHVKDIERNTELWVECVKKHQMPKPPLQLTQSDK